MPVVVEQLVAVLRRQRRPGEIYRNRIRLLIRRARALVRHLEKQQVGELLDVVAIAHPVVAQDVAVVPELLDDGRGVHGCSVGQRSEDNWSRAIPGALCSDSSAILIRA